MSSATWQVHKFGGTSLADADCFRRVAGVLRGLSDPNLTVVVSAMGGMTDALLRTVETALVSADDVTADLEALRARYTATAEELLPDGKERDALLSEFGSDLSDAANILNSVALVRSAPQRSRDLIVGYGELWSARLMAAFLSATRDEDPRSREAQWVDAREVIVVDSGELGPMVDWDASASRCAERYSGVAGGIAVVTGFIASNSEGLQTTLGRNGSDFSASIMGRLLDAGSITIWTDVDGVMSADPNRVPEAAIISTLSYNEAMELAYFGAKVIHPQTMAPAVGSGIPIFIRNTFNPDAPGSRISNDDSDRADDHQIKGITTVKDLALVNLEGAGMIGVPGTADRLFGALREAGISVVLISQASSEHSICFAVPSQYSETVLGVVSEAFSAELEQGQIQNVDIQNDCSIIAVVGDEMAGAPGIASQFFSTLGAAGINILAIAQGSSERNISAVIRSADATRALRAAHAGFYLSHETISLGLIGPGNVGQNLLAQMAAQVQRLRDEFNLDFRVRAIATSSRMLLAERQVDLDRWQEQLESDAVPLDWEVFQRHVAAEHLPHAAMIDCTASDEVAQRYADWFRAGIHVVTPNKKAHSGPMGYYDEMRAARRERNAHFLYETTVGAALPILQTLRDLEETGDEILSIEGIFSGTLAYLFNTYDGTRSFSEIVTEARESGYTEPDPRDDLSGMDVARKVIILAREIGMRLELDDIHVESLTPSGLEAVSVDEFMASLSDHDETMLARLKAARENNEILRYVGRLKSDGSATVQLESLPADHSFAHMNLTDNMVRFVSGRYSDNPLVVQGPGAGPAVTAAGAFADLLRLARFLGAQR